ncbi:hypothetical protein, partial [Robiginitalea aurantiaca]
EIQDLGSVLTEGNDAGGAAIANLADPTAAQDAATKAYVDAVADDDVTGAALDGSNVLTISEGTTDVTVDLSSLVDDADADPTNEYNTGIGFDGTNLTVTDAGGTQSVDISGVSTDDQDLTGATLTGSSLQIDIENGNSATVDLASLVDDADADPTNELQTLSQSGTDVTLSDGGGTISVADNDNDSSNEIQDL